MAGRRVGDSLSSGSKRMRVTGVSRRNNDAERVGLLIRVGQSSQEHRLRLNNVSSIHGINLVFDARASSMFSGDCWSTVLIRPWDNVPTIPIARNAQRTAMLVQWRHSRPFACMFEELPSNDLLPSRGEGGKTQMCTFFHRPATVPSTAENIRTVRVPPPHTKHTFAQIHTGHAARSMSNPRFAHRDLSVST